MKFRFDLLPQEYKSLPRDIFGIALAFGTIIICITWTMVVNARNLKAQAQVQTQIDEAKAKRDKIAAEAAAIQEPVGDINAIRNSINFVNQNLDTPGSSCVEFLFALESVVPEMVFIKDINPKDFTAKTIKFTIEGEAASLAEVLNLISKMQGSGYFNNVFLKQNSTIKVDSIALVQFTLECEYKGKS